MYKQANRQTNDGRTNCCTATLTQPLQTARNTAKLHRQEAEEEHFFMNYRKEIA
jgi:hypothetical protein